jgi:hypothetical protein
MDSDLPGRKGEIRLIRVIRVKIFVSRSSCFLLHYALALQGGGAEVEEDGKAQAGGGEACLEFI